MPGVEESKPGSCRWRSEAATVLVVLLPILDWQVNNGRH